MNSLIKKSVIYTMVGIMNVGIFAATAEASALSTSAGQMVELRRHDDNRHHNDRRRHYENRRRIENERHEREMRRRPHESYRHWRERQDRERERHEREMRILAAFLIGIAIASND